MSASQDLRLTKQFIAFARVSGLVVIVIGLIVLAGWAFDLGILESLLPGLPTMKANTAIALVFAGMALRFTSRGSTAALSPRIAQICGGAAGFLGLFTVGEYLFGWDAGIDQLIFLDLQIPQAAFPGRMALATAICFTLTGIAFILINSRSGKAIGVGQYFAAAVLSISVLALVGYVYDVQALYKLDAFSSMALNTALALTLCALGLLCARPDQGWMRLISTETAGGVVLRRLFPAVLGIPLGLSLLILAGERAGWYETHFGLAIISVLIAVFLVITLWLTGKQLNRIDEHRKQMEDALRISEERYRSVLDNLLEGAQIIGFDWRYLYVNATAARQGRQEKQNLLGHTMMEIYPGIESSELFLALQRCMQERTQHWMENEFIYPDGARGWFELSVQPVQDGLFILSNDITERKRAELELHQLNLELEQRVAERTTSLEASLNFIYALYDVLQTVTSFDDLPEVLQSVVDAVIRTISADRATVITFDHEKRQVTNFVKAGLGVGNVIESVPYEELMEGLSGWALRELRPAFSPKGEPDPRESPVVQKRRAETNCGCILVLPLIHLGEALGTMTVINTPEQPDLIEREVDWLEAIASQVSSAIGRAKIYDQLKNANLLLEAQTVQLQQELIDRKRIEATLAAERDLLQALMDNIPDTIYFKDVNSRFIRINRAQAKVLGVNAPEDAIGKTDLDFFHDEKLVQSFLEEEQQIVKTGAGLIGRVEFNPISADEPRWFSATKVPIKDEQGRVTGIVGISHNITKDKQDEEKLRQSEERFRLLAWATNDAVWDWDLQTNQIQWGAGLQKIFRYAPETIQPSTHWWFEHIHPEERVKVERSIRQALDAGLEFWSKEYRFQREDGTYADIMDRGYILRNEAGEPYRIIGSMIDITERKRAEETIRQKNEMLSRLHKITLNLLGYRESNELLNALVTLAADFLDAAYAEIMLLEGETLVVRAATDNQNEILGERVSREAGLLSWQAIDTRGPRVLSDYASWPHRRSVYDKFSLHAVADFPVLSGEQCIGVLAFGRGEPGYEFSPDQVQFGSLFANLAALVLNNAQLREALREQAIRDPLTGLFNRRYMEETLKREMSRVTRHLHPLGVIMLDIDHFKLFNDRLGHAAGDTLLREIGRFMQSHIRSEDVACRYGGEEFILIMPDVSLEVAVERAEQLRQAVVELQVRDGGRAHAGITLSLGVAIFPQHGRTVDAVLRAADAALYQAKQGGRNQVAVAKDSV